MRKYPLTPGRYGGLHWCLRAHERGSGMARDHRKEGLDSISEDEFLTTSQVVKLTGVTEDMLYNYCKKGLLNPQRTGENVANDRRLYCKDDLHQLHRIKLLLEYGLTLNQIKKIFDGEADVVELLQDKLNELRRKEARLHTLIRFAKFIDVTDEDMIDGLMYGSLAMDDLADLVRDTPEWEANQAYIEALTDDQLAVMREAVAPILVNLKSIATADSFAELERSVDAFVAWWKANTNLPDDVGFLQIWASFEDGSLAATQIEKAGEEGDCSTIQSALFYVFMKRLILETQDAINSIAVLADIEAAAVLPKANNLANTIVSALGLKLSERFSIPVAMTLLIFIYNVLVDRDLLTFLNPERAITLAPQAVERTLDVLHLLVPD